MASYPRANPNHAYPVNADRNLVGTFDLNEALRDLKNRSASPYASSSFRPPMNRETPVSNVAPVANQEQTAPMAMPQPGLLGGSPIGGGLLAASNVLSQAGMNSPMPRSLGSAIGPALNAFSQGYAQDQQTAIKRAREQALINKYGPEALVSGAIPALIAANAEKKNLANMQTLLGQTPENIEAKLGMKLTPSELAQITIAGNAKELGETIKSISKGKFDTAKVLRNEFGEKTKSLSKIIGAGEEAIRMLDANEGTGSVVGVDDLVTLYTTITALDPDSVVREGEVALGREIVSIIKNIKQKLDKVNEDRILPISAAKEMRQMVFNLASKAELASGGLETYYSGQAERLKIPIINVITPRRKLPSRKFPSNSTNGSPKFEK